MAVIALLAVAFLAQAESRKGYKMETVIYTDTLAMDIYTPAAVTNDQKPVFVYLHGGGFQGGSRRSAEVTKMSVRLTDLGWMVVSVSYHLTMKGQSFSCDQPVQNKINTLFVAAQNTHEAVKYLLDHELKYGVDKEQIVLAGSSAGAEAVMQAVYWQKTRMGILPEEFQYAGVVSMAGAILDINWVTKASAIPTALFHGTCDPLVPYDTAPHHYCSAEATGFMMLFGAAAVARRLESLGLGYFFFTDCGGGHEWAGKPIQPDWIYLIEDFLTRDVLQKKQRTVHEVVQIGQGQCGDREILCRD